MPAPASFESEAQEIERLTWPEVVAGELAIPRSSGAVTQPQRIPKGKDEFVRSLCRVSSRL